MNIHVERPVFAEGQILAAADLTGISDHARGRGERHDRYRHRAGVVHGLKLVLEGPRLFVTPGLALDALGREIVVTERVELDSRSFLLAVGGSAEKDIPYPVLLRSIFRPAAAEARGMLGSCGGASRAGRIEERAEIRFGRSGDEALLDEPAAPAPSTGPSAAEGAGPPLLLGFITWNPAAPNGGAFDKAQDTANGTERRLGGVNAAVVAGLEGKVLVQPEAVAAVSQLVLELDNTGSMLRFGRWTAPGQIEPLFSVDGDGNVEAKGTLTARPARGTVLVSSGRASDGLLLPLPPGVSAEQVSSGAVGVQVIVSPHVDPAFSPNPQQSYAAMVEECRVDADRRLHCRISWLLLNFAAAGPGAPGRPGTVVTSGPGLADYLVVCTVAAGGSGS
ncbi:MAG: hypothetical protein AB7O44_26440 [Hyphomicrobiaceae bacterium]